MSDLESNTPPLQKRLFTFLLNKRVPKVPSEEERKFHPEISVNVILKIMFWWLFPVMRVAYKRTVVPADMFKLTENLTVEGLHEKFNENFEMVLARARQRHLAKKKSKSDNQDDMSDFVMPKYITPLALFLTFKFPYSLACVALAISQLIQTLNPLLIRKLIQYVSLKNYGIEEGIGKGVGYALGVTFMILFNGIAMNYSFYKAMCVGTLAKSVLTKAILEKAYVLDEKSKHNFPVGKITSIMGADLSRVDFALTVQPFILTAPVPIICAIIILLVTIGVSALVGIGIMIIFMTAMVYVTKKVFKWRKGANIYTDRRVDYIKECLNNLRMIKFYSWEPPYFKSISDSRKTEMGIVFLMTSIRNLVTSFSMNMALFCSLFTFIVLYAVRGMDNAANVFSSLTIFNVLTQVFFLLPQALGAGSDAIVALSRVGELLLSSEINIDDVDIGVTEEQKNEMDNGDLAVKIDHATFEWSLFDDETIVEDSVGENSGTENVSKKSGTENVSEKPSIEKSANEKPGIAEESKKQNISVTETNSSLSGSEAESKDPFVGLRDIDIEIRKGEFLVVTGLIGSGKTSLLNAIAGMMKRTEGSVHVNGSLVFCSHPWIQNATVKENIIFGSEFDQRKYEEVIYSCSLESDLANLPAGDRTEVGERGITLSGGQKARINLARAVYFDQDIMLFDDVLSAVDAKVGKHIMQQCMLGILQNKTRILATHQLSLIGEADRIIFLNGDGSVSVGTQEELSESNAGFRNLMAYSKATDTDDSEEEVEEEISEIQNEKEGELTEKESGNTSISKAESSDDEAQHKEYNTDANADGTLILLENKAENSVGFKVVVRYFTNGCGSIPPLIMLMVLITLMCLATFCFFFTNTWLSFWTERKFDISDGKYIGVYILLTFMSWIFFSLEFILIGYITNRASMYLNIKAINKILYAPMSFMDTTPMGRILNRFTKDTDMLDNEMGEQARLFLFTLGNLFGVFILCIIFMPWLAIAVPIFIILIACFGSFYSATSLETKRLESVQRSFVYNNFNESLSGMETIKAYNAMDRFFKVNAGNINTMDECSLVFIAAQRWLTVNLSCVSASFSLIISMLCVKRVFNISASSSGLLLSYSIQLTTMLTMFMRNFTQVEAGMNSVERMCDFAFDLPSEAPYEIAETTPAPEWPQKGQVVFENASMAYRPGLPLVLKNLNIDIKPEEKIGICGRTGAGKSSIMSALYRITELSGGRIVIDGVDISQIGLKELRSKLSIIPQDPVLFRGTIRRNLDPFNQSSDDKLWDALRRSGLIDAEVFERIKGKDKTSHKFHLDSIVDDNGSNFSLGERQLISFARALVRESKILILDEATSSVDYETDAKIQQTIAREFGDCTILCIAHRLKTIIDYDKILVLDKGQVMEFDTPWNLFNSNGTIFQQMCQKSSIVAEDFNRK